MKPKTTRAFIQSSACLAVLAFASAALAENQVSIYGGWVSYDQPALEEAINNAVPQVTHLSTQSDYSFGLRYTYWAQNQWGVGLDFSNFSLSSEEIVDGFQSSSYSLIGLRRIDIGTTLEPYVGAGFGVQMKELEYSSEWSNSSIDYDPAFLATGVAGASYQLTDQFSVFTEFKFDYSGEASSSGASETFPNQLNPSVNFGVSLSF